MSSTSDKGRCSRADEVCLYALTALSPDETRDLESHLGSCEACREHLASLRPVVDSLAAWPATAVLRPSPSLWDQLVTRIAAEPRGNAPYPSAAGWVEPEWEDVAPGIMCKILSSDLQRDCVSMLVRLAPGTEYPPHQHAATEELYLLDGELWIDDRKLSPGDYNSAVANTADKRVWSETGCTCLLITSPSDLIS
jgi:quercetin dioxygenase-like cupin family protein